MAENSFELFTNKIEKRTGIDLSQYKENQMKRRLTKFYEQQGYSSFEEYYRAISTNPQILEGFFNKMTINVTEFFRNPKRWDFLKNTIIPEFLKRESKIKCWSAACSTGEEPYSLAMLFDDMNVKNFSITATDLDQGVLQKAREGLYVPKSLDKVENAYINRYFTKEELAYRIKPEIVRNVSFKNQNLLTDKFSRNYDLIVCRNVTIYFTEEAKDILFQRFSDSLRTDGYLFIGGTERINNPKKYGLKAVNSTFYQKIKE